MQLLYALSMALAIAGLLTSFGPAVAQSPPKVQIVYMGGNDCPPCVAWRREELPKLQAMEIFRRIEFVSVEKVIASTVPPRIFLPAAVKPLKDKLDYAANGMTGSPQTVFIVNGEVFDYIFGTRTAAQIEAAVLAIEGGLPYPTARCLRRKGPRVCEIAG